MTTMQPVTIICQPSYASPRLPESFRWAYRTDVGETVVTVKVSIMRKRHPVTALLFGKEREVAYLSHTVTRGSNDEANIEEVVRQMEKAIARGFHVFAA